MPSGSRRRGTAFIDLNAVRAGLANDPKDYRWCGYGEAAGGDKTARTGLMEVFADHGPMDWKAFGRAYRKLLFSAGEQRISEEGKPAWRGISPAKVEEVLNRKGELT